MTSISTRLKQALAFDARKNKPAFKKYNTQFDKPEHWASSLDWAAGGEAEHARTAPIFEAMIECVRLVERLDITLQGHEEGRWTREALARLETLLQERT